MKTSTKKKNYQDEILAINPFPFNSSYYFGQRWYINIYIFHIYFDYNYFDDILLKKYIFIIYYYFFFITKGPVKREAEAEYKPYCYYNYKDYKKYCPYKHHPYKREAAKAIAESDSSDVVTEGAASCKI